MGKYRFKFSDMMPNAWFYKLKDMSKTRKQPHYKQKQTSATTTTSQQQHHHQPPHISLPRYSYYFTTEPSKVTNKLHASSPVNPKAADTHFPDPSRKSSKKNARRKTIYKPSPRHATVDPVWIKSSPNQSPDYFISSPESSIEPDFHDSPLSDFEEEKFVVADSFCQQGSWCNSCNCDIIIDLNSDDCFSENVDQKLDGFDTISEMELPPILTKPAKFHEKSPEVIKSRTRSSLSVKIVKEGRVKTQKEQRTSPLIRKSSSNAAGIRLRANSPKIASKKIQQAHARKSTSSNTCSKPQNKSLSESFVVVKSSIDPLRDFRDSMVEMIVENNLRNTKDLEDLLACYLSLNSNEYHELIVKAFEQVWLDLTNLSL